MYPFWKPVAFPAIKAAGANSIVEIGALRGENTRQLIRDIGPDAVVHVIDPVPDFDPATHEAAFPGQYVFHQALSLDVLDELPAMDAALIDGDHNWYTVYNECRALARAADEAGRPLPLLILHDVGWPYGRRDLYYDPSTIPVEHRQPYAVQGINRRTNELQPRGGFNKTLAHAKAWGGPRNGVLTGLEDFLDGFSRPCAMITFPIYYGLAIVAEEALLAERPGLAALFAHFTSPEGKDEIIELGEAIRLDAAMAEQNYLGEFMRRADELATEYLDLLQASVLGELGIEQEARIDHLRHVLRTGKELDEARLRDPARLLQPEMQRARARHRGGSDALPLPGPATSAGSVVLGFVRSGLDELVAAGVSGDLVDVSVEGGGLATLLAGYCRATFQRTRSVWAIDSFDAAVSADLYQVRESFERHGLLGEHVRFLAGAPDAAVAGSELEEIAFLHIGLLDPTALDALFAAAHGRLADGALVVVRTDGRPELEAIVSRCGTQPLHRVDHRTISYHHRSRLEVVEPAASRAREDLDLSFVVVVHDMMREAPRTLHSLSRAYQQGVDDIRYQVVVVDNGSPPAARLSRAQVEAYGPEFRYIELGDAAAPSPTVALNEGIAHSDGRLVALMIDGAHLLSPGVVHQIIAADKAYGPAMVTVQPFHLGPGQQGTTIAEGYGPHTEDDLMGAIGWPGDGYRLFDISSFQEDRDWFDPMWESNCLVVPRATLTRSGGYDDRFDEPGGGFANLELFERCGTDPDLTHVTILGEGTFHQVHGGLTTNEVSPEARADRIARYRERYEALRGRPFTGPRRTVHYVGSLAAGSRRTKGRELTPRHFR